VQVISDAVDSSSYTNGDSVVVTYSSENVCSGDGSVCSNGVEVVSPLHGTGSTTVTAHRRVVETDRIIDVEDCNMDILDVNDGVDLLSETTLDYSVCSSVDDSKIADSREAQTAMDCCVESMPEYAVDAEKNQVTDIRMDSSLSNDLQKPVDLLAIPNNVNVDLRNSRTVCSRPPTLVVV